VGRGVRAHLQILILPIARYVNIMHELPQDKAIEFIKTKKYGNLALCGRNQPYCIPIAYTHTDAVLLLYQSSRGRALEYLEANQRACFEIHDITGFRDWKSVIIEGWISRVTDPAELRDALRTIEKNINLTEGSYEDAARAITSGKAGGVYKILIEKLSAVQS
jgi:nitroimidazol reductase NimA-like FMN-containing flavoprotein (pyridoxamine 5'-phosphate oxidase superfamily)